MANHTPKVPEMLNPLAREILEELRGKPDAEFIIIGGGVALQHYLPYRQTADLDAWWSKDVSQDKTKETLTMIKEVMGKVASKHELELAVRASGESISFELKQGIEKQFALQIATRTVELERPLNSEWAPIKIETMRENLAAKMNALVARGAPRDYIDIYTACKQGLIAPKDGWKLWQAKNPTGNLEQAATAVLTKLRDIEARRPLTSISNPQERISAALVRNWFQSEFTQEIRNEIKH